MTRAGAAVWPKSCGSTHKVKRAAGDSSEKVVVRVRSDTPPQGVTNQLDRDFGAETPNTKWVTDIISIRTSQRLIVSGGHARFVYPTGDWLVHVTPARP